MISLILNCIIFFYSFLPPFCPVCPRVDFPRGYADPYNLTFRSGWETPRLDASGQPWEDPVEMQHRHEERRAQVSDEVESRQDKHLQKKKNTHTPRARGQLQKHLLLPGERPSSPCGQKVA